MNNVIKSILQNDRCHVMLLLIRTSHTFVNSINLSHTKLMCME